MRARRLVLALEHAALRAGSAPGPVSHRTPPAMYSTHALASTSVPAPRAPRSFARRGLAPASGAFATRHGALPLAAGRASRPGASLPASPPALLGARSAPAFRGERSVASTFRDGHASLGIIVGARSRGAPACFAAASPGRGSGGRGAASATKRERGGRGVVNGRGAGKPREKSGGGESSATREKRASSSRGSSRGGRGGGRGGKGGRGGRGGSGFRERQRRREAAEASGGRSNPKSNKPSFDPVPTVSPLGRPLLTRRDADREALKLMKQTFQTASTALEMRKHHATFKGHGPPHKRVFSCEMRVQVPRAWMDLGFLGPKIQRASSERDGDALRNLLAERAASASLKSRGACALAEGSGKEKGEVVLECYGGGVDYNKNDAQRLAIADAFASIRFATEGAVDPASDPPNVGRMLKEQHKAALRAEADFGRQLLELVDSSRPTVTHQSSKGAWDAVVTAFVDGGKRLEARGRGAAKGDAEDAAYGEIAGTLPGVVGRERFATLAAVARNSPGNSAAMLRVPPLPDDAMDALITAMGTPEDHDRRMRAVRAAERRAMRAALGRDAFARGGDDDAKDGGYRRRKDKAAAHTAGEVSPAGEASLATEEGVDGVEALAERFRAEEAARRARADPASAAMRETRANLPISAIRDSLNEALRSSPVVVVSGGTGSGKSTQCPQYVLEDAIERGLGPETRIVVTQPRRIAAVSVAERVAAERGERCGTSVGFSVRLHGVAPREEGASVEFVTTGVLLRRLTRDPTLRGVSHVVIDEVHERDINTDFLLVLLRSLLEERPELRVVLMSATLDAESFSDYFSRNGGAPAPLLSVPTKPRYPVEMFYLEDLAGETNDEDDEDEREEDAEEEDEPSEEDEDAFETGAAASVCPEGGMGAKLSLALLEAQDEMLERELEEAVAEERAADALEACDESEDGECDLAGPAAGLDESEDPGESDPESDPESDWEALEVEVEGGGPSPRGRSSKGRTGRLAHRVRTLRRAVEMRRDERASDAEDVDAFSASASRAPVSRAARQAVRRARNGGKTGGGGGGGGKLGDKREREELVVALAAEVARDVARAELARGNRGSVLVFLPGWDEIKEIMKRLESDAPAAEYARLRVIPLHSQVPQEEQQTVFDPAPEGCVKIILATNIAESSVTIDDVLAVVDSGLVREMSYNPESAMSMMGTVATSRASATQRAGRAGRVAPGACYRLYSRATFEAMSERPTPEIQRTALEATCLQTCGMIQREGLSAQRFLAQAMDPPATETVALAMDRLKTLGAIADVRDFEEEEGGEDPRITGGDGGDARAVAKDASAPAEALTPLGRLLSQLPLDPATGRMLVVGVAARCLDPVLTAAACMSSRDPFVVPTGMRDEAQAARRRFCATSDHLAVLRAYREWRWIVAEDGFDAACRWARENFLSVQGLQNLTSLRGQLLNELARIGLVRRDDLQYGGGRNKELRADAEANRHAANEALCVAVLLTGLPGNVASRRQQAHFGVMRTRLEEGAGLHPACVAFQRSPPRRRSEQAALPKWFLYKEMVQSSQVFLRDCSAVTPEQVMLFGGSKITKPPAIEEGEGQLFETAEGAAEVDERGETNDSGFDAGGGEAIRDSTPAEADPFFAATAPPPPSALIDDWIVVSSSCADTSELLVDVRREIDAAVSLVVMQPRRPLPKASEEILDAVAATMHVVEARNEARLRQIRRSEGGGREGGYDRFANRDGFGDGGRREGRAGMGPRAGFGRDQPRGRLRRDADGNFVRSSKR